MSDLAQLLVLGAMGLLVLAFVGGGLHDPMSVTARWLPVLVVLSGAACCAIRAVASVDTRSAWAVMSVALLSWAAGSASDALTQATPAAADGLGAVCRVAFYPLAYLALVQLVRGRIKRFATALWLDGLIGALAVAAVGMGVVVQPAIATAEGDLTQLVLRLVLPLGDMLLLAFIAGVMALNGWRPGRAWTIIGCSFGVMALSHAIELGYSESTFPGFELVALIHPIGIALIGLAAWRPSTLATQLRIEGWGLLVGPTLFGWLTVGLVAYGNFVELGALGLFLATVTLILVMVRTGLTFRENIAIAEELRSEVAQSARDPLTGLYNHRLFQELLNDAVDEAIEGGHDLSLVVFDIDDFREINDRYGHEAGDTVLRSIASQIADRLRNEDRVARIGGEEFACVLPRTNGTAAWLVAERARTEIEATDYPGIGTVTVSAGVCDLSHAAGANDLLRLTDGALYWAKTHGRNSVARYQPDLMDVLSAEDRAAQAERARTLSAVSALARAVDAKDATTQRHSERVSTIAGAIAARLGWTPDRIVALREAALVHDVGKIGVPDSVLSKAGQLDDAERAIMQTHPALGAQIVRDVLSDEQTLWVRHHHERWDGRGYPDQIIGEDIPTGALILAVADSWDAMTANRPYRSALAAERALQILSDGSGTQWWPDAITVAIDLFDDEMLVASIETVAWAEQTAPLDAESVLTDRPIALGAEFDPVTPGEDLSAPVPDRAADGDRVEPPFDQLLA